VSEQIWSLKELARFTRFEDPEVRYWAVDRLIRHHSRECCDTIADLLFDEHDLTPSAVARHLGEAGAARHHAGLVRGFRLLRGMMPALCLQALARLGHPGTVDLAASALKRGDLTDPALATIVEALSELDTPPARALVREFVARRGELLAEPAALRGVLRGTGAAEIPEMVQRFVGALQWRGSHRAGESFRTLMDVLHVDDTSWCFRTGPSGHIELRKTIKAVESGYDCDISSALGKGTVDHIAQRFRAGSPAEIIRAIAEWTCAAARGARRDADSDQLERIAAAVETLARPDLLEGAERMGHQFQQWVIGFQLSAAFAVARGHNFDLALRRARGQLAALLRLAELETSFLLSELPGSIAAVCRDVPERARQAEEWCLRMLEAKGPFFPKVVALETLGELGAVHFVPEMMEYLSDENSYVYGAAEHALSRLGEAIIAPAEARIDGGSLDLDAAHSMLVLLCDMGTRAAHAAVVRHLDWFMDAVGPGTAAEWVSLLGTVEMIDPLRDWLDQDPATVGQGLLLLGAIHNVRIPEEADILQAIEEARESEDPDAGDEGGVPGGDRGDYVM